MTERERWVVYPLLFLALGASLRDKLGGRTTTKSIVCQELRVEEEPIGNQNARVLALIGRTEPGPGKPSVGYLMVNGQIGVDGAVNVNGMINANQYLFRGLPLVPGLQAVIPGTALHNLFPTAPPAAETEQQVKDRAGKSQSPTAPAPAQTLPGKSTPAADSTSPDDAPPDK